MLLRRIDFCVCITYLYDLIINKAAIVEYRIREGLGDSWIQAVVHTKLSGIYNAVAEFIMLVIALYFIRSENISLKSSEKIGFRRFFLITYLVFVLNCLIISGFVLGVDISGVIDSPIKIIIMGFLTPVVEELVFRGVVLNYLRCFGIKSAIIFSALVFGMAHGEFTQGVFAFFGGLIFGYVSVFFGIKYTIVLHIINNTIFFYVLPLVLTREVYLGLILFGVVLSSIFLCTSINDINRRFDSGFNNNQSI